MPATSCREQIVAAVLAALDPSNFAPNTLVVRNRRAALDDGELPAVILFEGPEQPDILFTGEDQYRLSLLVQGAITGSDADAALAANTLRAQIIQVLRTDVSLGGKARNLEIVDAGDWIGTQTVSDETEGFFLQADVTYATAEGDPFTFAT